MGNHARTQREAVAGFDLTFSPPKSVSVLWALADPKLQADLYEAHQQAVAECLDWLEHNVIQARAGHAGVAWVPVKGAIASLFDHWDSRAGDPQLHTHAVIANRVQRTSDGKWVTLDSYTLHRHMVAVSEKYNSILYDRIYDRTGALAELRDGVAGCPESDVEDLLSEFEDAGTDARNVRAELAAIPDGSDHRVLHPVTGHRRPNREAHYRVGGTTRQTPAPVYGAEHAPPSDLGVTSAVKKPATESLPEKMVSWRAPRTGLPATPRHRDSGFHRPRLRGRRKRRPWPGRCGLLGQLRPARCRDPADDIHRANLIASTERLLRGDPDGISRRIGNTSSTASWRPRPPHAVSLSPERMGSPRDGEPVPDRPRPQLLRARGNQTLHHHQDIDDEAFLIEPATTASDHRVGRRPDPGSAGRRPHPGRARPQR